MKDALKENLHKRKRLIKIIALALFVLFIVVTKEIVDFKSVSDEQNTEKGSVSLEIRCDQLAEDPSQLKNPEKAKWVPKDGIILAKTKYVIQGGDTVFDVLQHACQDKKIQMEHSMVPIYHSAYVEGIHQIYEFDAGKRSGWIYFVNGEKAEYGCSQYELHDGDEIVWEYVCDYSK